MLQFATPTPGVNNEPQSDPRYGANFNPFAIGGVPAEGAVRIAHREIHGKFADGETYTLLAPKYAFEELAYGELAHDTVFSPRVAPSVFGVGLLEAIPESQILELAGSGRRRISDGISGRANRVWDHLTRQRASSDGSAGRRISPTSRIRPPARSPRRSACRRRLRPGQNCTNVQALCLQAPTGGEPEISDEIFQRIVAYQRMLGVPARRNLDCAAVKHGARAVR